MPCETHSLNRFSCLWRQIDFRSHRKDNPRLRCPKSKEIECCLYYIRQCRKASLIAKFLAWLHKELPAVYKEKFIEGQKLYAEGIRKGDPTMQIKGNQLMMEWQSFWETHKMALTDKMYPK